MYFANYSQNVHVFADLRFFQKSVQLPNEGSGIVAPGYNVRNTVSTCFQFPAVGGNDFL